jgi:hypothetical protein
MLDLAFSSKRHTWHEPLGSAYVVRQLGETLKEAETVIEANVSRDYSLESFSTR